MIITQTEVGASMLIGVGAGTVTIRGMILGIMIRGTHGIGLTADLGVGTAVGMPEAGVGLGAGEAGTAVGTVHGMAAAHGITTDLITATITDTAGTHHTDILQDVITATAHRTEDITIREDMPLRGELRTEDMMVQQSDLHQEDTIRECVHQADVQLTENRA